MISDLNEKEKSVAFHVGNLLYDLGLDLNDPHLRETPERVAKMYSREFFRNINSEFTKEEYSLQPNIEGYDEIICSDKIESVSMCSHHLLPFKFLAWMMYIPDTEIIGASKFARLIDHYARRPQTQERLCHQIIENFIEHVKPKGAMIVIRGHHGCMQCRGIRQSENGFSTSAVRGIFKKYSHLEMKGYELIKISLLHKE